MKHFSTALFLLLLLLVSGARGQNFSPFRPGSQAQYTASAGDTIRLLQLQKYGSSPSGGSDSLYLFVPRVATSNGNPQSSGFFGCYARFTAGPFGQGLGVNNPGTMRAEYRLLSDFNRPQNFYEKELLLKPRAPLNQSWIAALGLTAQVVARAVQPVLGIPDSVVTIAFSGGQQLTLSKAHGLVEAPFLAYFFGNGPARRLTLTALPGMRLGQPLLGALAVYDFQPGDRLVYQYNRFSPYFNPSAPPNLTYFFTDSILSRTTSRTGDTLTYRVFRCSAQSGTVPAVTTVRYTATGSFPGRRSSQVLVRSTIGSSVRNSLLFDAVRGPYPTTRAVQRAFLSLGFCTDTTAIAGPNIDLYTGANYATGLGCVLEYYNDYFGTTTSTTLVGYRKGNETWGTQPLLPCRSALLTRPTRPAATTAAFPNPFGAELAVAFTLTRPQAVGLTLHDALGRVVLEKAAAALSAGAQTLSLPTASLPVGVYSLHLHFGQEGRTEVLRVLKTE